MRGAYSCKASLKRERETLAGRDIPMQGAPGLRLATDTTQATRAEQFQQP